MVNNIANGVNISTVKSKDELPNSIIVTQVPEEVFTNPESKEHFCQLFTQIEENIHFDFLKSFRRVRVIFSTPESATAAKLIVQGFSFHGHEMKAFLAQIHASSWKGAPHVVSTADKGPDLTFPKDWETKISRVILRRSSQLLSPPPLEKQFLISPPCSPPLGWAQTKEMAPVICNFDLMARLASFALEDKYEVYNGDESKPAIVVHPCETPLDAPSSIEMPRTPRPSSPP